MDSCDTSTYIFQGCFANTGESRFTYQGCLSASKVTAKDSEKSTQTHLTNPTMHHASIPGGGTPTICHTGVCRSIGSILRGQFP